MRCTVYDTVDNPPPSRLFYDMKMEKDFMLPFYIKKVPISTPMESFYILLCKLQFFAS
jgi:hypothetical protein